MICLQLNSPRLKKLNSIQLQEEAAKVDHLSL